MHALLCVLLHPDLQFAELLGDTSRPGSLQIGRDRLPLFHHLRYFLCRVPQEVALMT